MLLASQSADTEPVSLLTDVVLPSEFGDSEYVIGFPKTKV